MLSKKYFCSILILFIAQEAVSLSIDSAYHMSIGIGLTRQFNQLGFASDFNFSRKLSNKFSVTSNVELSYFESHNFEYRHVEYNNKGLFAEKTEEIYSIPYFSAFTSHIGVNYAPKIESKFNVTLAFHFTRLLTSSYKTYIRKVDDKISSASMKEGNVFMHPNVFNRNYGFEGIRRNNFGITWIGEFKFTKKISLAFKQRIGITDIGDNRIHGNKNEKIILNTLTIQYSIK